MLIAILLAVVFGAAGAALAALVCARLNIGGDKRLAAMAVAGIVSAVASQGLQLAMERRATPVGPHVFTDTEMAGLLAADPGYAAIRQYYPETWKRMVAAAKTTANGAGEAEGMRAARTLYTRLLSDKLLVAEHPLTVAMAQLGRDQAEAALAKGPETCMAFLAGGADLDPASAFPADLREREGKLAAAVFAQTALAPHPTTSDVAQAHRDLDAIRAQASEGLGPADAAATRKLGDPQAIPLMTPQEQTAACRYSIRLMDALIALPRDRAAALFKSMQSP
jgi:hypothetical protein